MMEQPAQQQHQSADSTTGGGVVATSGATAAAAAAAASGGAQQQQQPLLQTQQHQLAPAASSSSALAGGGASNSAAASTSSSNGAAAIGGNANFSAAGQLGAVAVPGGRSARLSACGVGARVIRGPDWKWGKQVLWEKSEFRNVACILASLFDSSSTLVHYYTHNINQALLFILSTRI